MVNFPASLDSLSNPGATTLRNDPGFELHTVISNIQDILEVLESKVGITDSPAHDSPLANTILASLANGKTGYRQVATADVAANAITQNAQAVGSTSNPTTTSTTFVDLNEMSLTLTTVGGDLLVWISSTFTHNNAGNSTSLALSLDGAAEVGERVFTTPVAGYAETVSTLYRFTGVSAASHTVKGRWKVSANTATAFGTMRSIVALEVKK